MKRRSAVRRGVWGVIALIIGLLYIIYGGGAAVYADVNNFYFEDFTGDYYLSKDENGVSRLKVVEEVTAVFPEYRQNKGICRMIPFTNQDGANVTLESLTWKNIKVTRNGVTEPIYSINKNGDYYEVCTGTEEYVLGRQVYGFEYEFKKVVTDFGDYQELYWDTNGTGSSQRFDKVTARVHFVGDVAAEFTGKSWCYVGSYGKSGQERCTISEISDGVLFVATGLKAYENLTFDVEIKAGSFAVPGPEYNYAPIWIMVGAGVILALFTGLGPVRWYLKESEKRKFYKDLFVKPEYQPHPKYSVAEVGEIYLGKKKDAKVAVLLDMIIKKKVELSKTGEKKTKGWKLKTLNYDGVGGAQRAMLAILNGGTEPEVGDEVEIKAQRATSKLIALGREYDKGVERNLLVDGLIEKGYKVGGSAMSGGFAVAIVFLITFGFPMFLAIIDNLNESGLFSGKAVGIEWFLPVMVAELLVAVVVWSVLYMNTQKYKVRTKTGLEVSRYMDGARLYIEMAEADRLKFLQSVKGADMSNEGVVHLYEKMLPYAAVLGLENSWMKELEKYYRLDDVTEPDWYRSGIRVNDMYFAATLASTYSRNATTMSSGSGGSSSGFSGGGGGGFSGGGGGGGGFGGR